MSASYLLGIDLGGGGIRCLLLDCESGDSVHTSRTCPTRRTPGTGGLGVDLDLTGIWAALGAATREVLQRAEVTSDRVVGIAASSLRFGTVVIDRDGAAILAVPNSDARAAGEGLRMAAEHGKTLQDRTGHWPSPIMAAPRLQWLAAQRTDVWKHAAHFFSISDWLTWRLSGEALADPSQASPSLLFRLAESDSTQHPDWDWDWIDELGFPRAIFPEMRESGTRAGSLCEDAARALGLLPGTPVAVGGADTQCALLGLGAIAPLQVAAIAGSTAPIQVVVGRPLVDPEGRLWTARHVVPERWVVESNAGATGDAVAWAARVFYPEAQQSAQGALDPLDLPGAQNAVARLFGEAALAEVGAAGQLSTLGTQIMNARALGMPTGDLTFAPMSSAHEAEPRRHLARAICEGIACGLRANLEQLRAVVGGSLRDLVLGGGMAQSASFAAMLCDVLDAPLAVSQQRQESARGAALCAGVSAGVWPDLPAAAAAAAAPCSVLRPDAQRAAASQSVFANWTQLRVARAQSEQLAGQLATPWVMAANERAATTARATTRPRVLVCADFDALALDALRELAEVEYASFRDKMRMLKGESLVAAAADFDVLVVEIDLVDADSIAKLPNLRVVVACRGDAVNIDIAACTAHGIPVLNTPGRNADAVADLTIAFLLISARKLSQALPFLRQPGIEAGDMATFGRAYSTLQGSELWRKTVGLVGFGAVGRKVARRLSGFGSRVLVSDPFVSPEEAAVAGARWVPFNELLATSDYVSLHAAVTDETRNLIDAKALARMKPGAVLVNTARAALTDEAALAEALETGRLGGLALDTFSVEPPGSEHPLLAFENVIATPHMGGNTRDVAAHQGQIVVAELKRLLTGERPSAILNPEVLTEFDWQAPRRRPNAEELAGLSKGDAPAVSDLQKGKAKAPPA